MMVKQLVLLSLPLVALAADLPVREVILYKHGVGFFSRSGAVAAGETAQLAFKASDMNDVLKSLTILDSSGAPVSGVRYDASEPLQQRMADFAFRVPEGAPLVGFLDQMKGARIELGPGHRGTLLSARLAQPGDRELVVLLTDDSDFRTVDLSSVPYVRFSDPKLQAMLRDYLAIVSGARSRDRRNVLIEGSQQGPRNVTASYMLPAPVWKSSYRLIFPASGDPTLEGWAIVDNTSGEDWTNVRLSVVSGRPISFVSQLYAPKYITRPGAEVAENAAAAPQVFEGVMAANLAAERADARAKATLPSSIAPATVAQEVGDLFEYRFSSPVTVKQGESAMLPFLQQKLAARKLLIYSERFGLNPQNAAELTNSTGKTLDGGPITVYDAGVYAGEALVETLKDADKRLINYGVDLGTRITTKIDSSVANVREIHLKRGVLTTRSAIQETKAYTIYNVDAGRKTILIEHPLRAGYTLVGDVQPKEVTSTALRFEVVVGGKTTETFVVKEERVYDQTSTVSSLTPDVLAGSIQGRPLSATGRTQMDRIVAKKREVAGNQAALQAARTNLETLAKDQDRYRQNIGSLRNVAGQDALVQQYARQLSDAEAKLTALRDQEAQLQRAAQTLQSELNALIEAAEF
jgi:chaperonin cofactor prefoldin